MAAADIGSQRIKGLFVKTSNSSLNPEPQQELPLRGSVAVRLARR
jgi:hypothetical protein